MLLEPTTWYQLRESSLLEMTEFEWFHWWPFYALLALFSLVLVTTTLRRIPLNTVNLGVWGIHSGIIILVIVSSCSLTILFMASKSWRVWEFASK